MSDVTQPTAAPEGSGQGFGDYTLVDRIAQGGMAELFLAKRRGVEGFEKTLAIKRILPELSWNREFVSMFINEAKIAARLSHPNIVQIFDFGKIDNYYFIAMEYVHGENLREILKRTVEKKITISADVAALVIARACAGLDHAHRKVDETGKPLRIIHRDVSPQNVLVSFDGDVKVVDFGIAKAVAESPEATRGILKGKLAYLSPEQVSGMNLDARSDIFAIGLVLYELLVGKKLFDMVDPAEILDAIVHIDSNQVAKSVPGIDKSVREVLRRALAADPNQRFNSAGEMQGALEKYLRDRGDPGGTLQLSNIMRLLFDDKIGENTANLLREQVMGVHGSGAVLRSGSALRLGAALAGVLLGAVALVFAAPRLRPAEDHEGTQHDTVARISPTQVPRAEDEKKTDLASRPAGEPTAVPVAPQSPPPAAEPKSAPAAEIDRAEVAKALVEEGKGFFDNDADTAAARFKTAANADPDSFDAHFFLAKIETRRGDQQAAQREYQEAIRINPKSADAQFNLGFVYFSQKRYDDALRQYEKVVKLNPPYLADVFYNLSACYEQMKRKSDAVATLRRGLQAVPNSELLRQRLRQLGG